MAALSHMAPMIIAIDGPAASGKGTLGKRLAHHYGYRHLDTGVIYRAVAKALLDEGFDLTDEARAVAAAMELDPEKFGHPELKTQRIGDAASVVSAIPSVREALVNFQRQFAADPPGAVLDGRDIGTVICPNADVKIFVVADPQVRARRRTLEALARGEAADEALVLADILKRDERDQNRAAAPLKAADGRPHPGQFQSRHRRRRSCRHRHRRGRPRRAVKFRYSDRAACAAGGARIRASSPLDWAQISSSSAGGRTAIAVRPS